VLFRAGLIDAARKQEWTRLDEMLAYITGKDRDEVFAASLVRLLRACSAERKWPVLLKTLKDTSPLVRASAAAALTDGISIPGVITGLLETVNDDYKLVRIRAAAALASYPPDNLDQQNRESLEHAAAEHETSLKIRPDQFASHYNLGNLYMDRRLYDRAISSFKRAIKLRPDFVSALVNISFAHNILGDNSAAEQSLRKAFEIAPESLAVNINLGMLLGEQNRTAEAEKYLLKAMEINPKSAKAAYNLAVIAGQDRNRISQAVEWCRKANKLQPDEPKYAYTLAYYQHSSGDAKSMVSTLQSMVKKQMPHAGAYLLLGDIYIKQGKTEKAKAVYRKATENKNLPEQERYRFKVLAESIREK
jgi:tetratricopeptide (TPR) repeat protein